MKTEFEHAVLRYHQAQGDYVDSAIMRFATQFGYNFIAPADKEPLPWEWTNKAERMAHLAHMDDWAAIKFHLPTH